MRKIVPLVMVIWFGLFLVTGVVAFAVRQQPTPSRLAALHMTDCALPCWIGIVPGETTLNEARDLINGRFGESPTLLRTEYHDSATSAVDLITWKVGDPSSPANIRLGTRDGVTLDRIEIAFTDDRITVSDVYSILGAPGHMVLWNQNFPYFVMAYGSDDLGLLTFTSLSDRFRWTQPVRAIVIYANGRGPAAPKDWRPWIGFRTFKDYYDRLP